jgi:hypothetical protein
MRKGSNFSAVILFLAAVTLPMGAQSFYGRIFGAILDAEDEGRLSPDLVRMAERLRLPARKRAHPD